ncbi:hypothetical protein DY000_02059140 [Brassica cretica]|uniref:Uncharacterized protein n=1 Tax=Brassica cretica TaxID=69181 RepID=A0ABQ7AW03_BRACR|nr:hypothetical protein DY000_02059140 [Brassica cretica]
MVFNELPNWVRVRDRFGDWKRGRETWTGTRTDAQTNASLSQQRWPEIERAKILLFRERIARADWVSNLPCPIDSWPKQRLPLFASKRKTATDRMDFPDLSSFIGEELGLEKVGLLAVLDAISTRASCPIGGVPQTNVTMAILPRSGDADSLGHDRPALGATRAGAEESTVWPGYSVAHLEYIEGQVEKAMTLLSPEGPPAKKRSVGDVDDSAKRSDSGASAQARSVAEAADWSEPIMLPPGLLSPSRRVKTRVSHRLHRRRNSALLCSSIPARLRS